jgi:hypothetical protein
MKTLIITGTVENNGKGKYEYDLVLYGQSPDLPLVQLITVVKGAYNGYDEIQRICRNKYCEYYKTDLNNIVSLENINRI